MTLFNPVFNRLTPKGIKRLKTQADEGLTTADEAGSVVLRQPPASKLANLFRIDTSKEPSAGLMRFLETNFFASTVCETSSRHVRWDNVHHAYTGDPLPTYERADGATHVSHAPESGWGPDCSQLPCVVQRGQAET